MPDLYKRAITAFFFGLLVLGALWLGYYAISALFILFTAICLNEFYQLCLSEKTTRSIRYYYILVGILPAVYFFIRSLDVAGIGLGFLNQIALQDVSVLLASWTVAFFAGTIWLLFNRMQQKTPGITALSFGLLYISIPFCLALLFSWQLKAFATLFMLALFLIIWGNDIMAYVAGSLFGKTPFFSKYSPKKTWEGFIGGLVASLLIGYALHFWLTELPLPHWLILAGIVSTMGTIGDLFESALKRQANRKDSGNWLPGHGGLLDRLDGFIFMLPFVYAFLVFTGYL